MLKEVVLKMLGKAISIYLALTLLIGVMIAVPVAFIFGAFFVLASDVYLYVRDGRPIKIWTHFKEALGCANH